MFRKCELPQSAPCGPVGKVLQCEWLGYTDHGVLMAIGFVDLLSDVVVDSVSY